MVLGRAPGTGQLPERCNRRVVHPPGDQLKVPLDTYGNEVEHADGRGGRPPVTDTVEQVITGRRAADTLCRLTGQAPPRVYLGFLSYRILASLGLLGFLAYRILASRFLSSRVEAGPARTRAALTRPRAHVGAGVGGGDGTGVGVGVGERHGEAPVRSWSGRVPQR